MENNIYKNVLIEILEQSLKTNNTNTALHTLRELKELQESANKPSESDLMDTVPSVVVCDIIEKKHCPLFAWWQKYMDTVDRQGIVITTQH